VWLTVLAYDVDDDDDDDGDDGEENKSERTEREGSSDYEHWAGENRKACVDSLLFHWG